MRPVSSSGKAKVRVFTSLACAALAAAFAVEPSAAQTPKPPAQKPVPQPAPSPEDRPIKDKTPANCTHVSASVVSEAYGYKHVVSLRNGCERPVECQVWTDVDPTPRNVLRAQKGETIQIVTRIGSPASDFKALKECRYM
jgi:hypothetical protein